METFLIRGGTVSSELGTVVWCNVCARVNFFSGIVLINNQCNEVTKTTCSKKLGCYKIKGPFHWARIRA